MFKRAYDIAILFKEYFLLAVYLVLSIALFAFNTTDQVRVLRSHVLGITAGLQNAAGFIPNYFSLREENRILREQNLSLSDEVNRLREAKLENLRLHTLLDLKDRPAFTYITASVVGAQVQSLRNTITINAGSDNGIRNGMPAVTNQGLVGRVTATSRSYAIIQLLLHKDLRVSARIQRSRVTGIVRWMEGRTLRMASVPKTMDVRPGDVLVTSDYSSIFPSGIRVGIIASTREVPGELFQEILVTPAVDFDRLEEVFVATVLPDSSRVALERRVAE